MATSLLLLPGVGADRRLFHAQRTCATHIDVIPWIAPTTPDESLPDYASRLAATIDASEPFVLGGASFGGMVALELARHLRPAAVLLIASCRSPYSLPSVYRYLNAAAQLLPAWAFTSAAARSRPIASRFGLTTHAERRLFAAMLRDTPPSFVQWACRAILGWPGAAEPDVPVHHIHGANDRIIPLRGVQPTVVVPDAGHFLNVTHPAAVNTFIDTVCRPLQPV
jgi:pimeloyl-ACP methyl ester carboxylesterase